jgi:hypothetical protein
MTGTQPFVGETLFDLMRAQMEHAPPSPRQRRPEMPLSIEHVILSALEKDPARRFQSAGAMAHALRQAAQELGADQWISLSGRSLTGGRLSFDQLRVPTPSTDPARIPTHLATPIPQDVAKTERTPPSRKGLYGAIAGITIVGSIVGAIVLARGKTETGASGGGAGSSELVASGSGEIVASVGSGSAPAPAAPPVEPVAPPPPPTNAGSAPPPHPPTRSTTPPPPPPAANAVGSTKSTEISPGVTLIESVPPTGAPKKITQPFAGNPKKFDAMAFAPKALALARQLYPDAGFTRLDTYSVFPSGLTDLTIGDDETTYWFRSPSHSARPAGIPKNQEVEIFCYVEVEVSAKQIEAWVREVGIDANCKAPIRPLPKCSLAGVWAKAKAQGADADTIAKIGFLTDGEWFFDNDGDDYDGLTESFADKCP